MALPLQAPLAAIAGLTCVKELLVASGDDVLLVEHRSKTSREGTRPDP